MKMVSLKREREEGDETAAMPVDSNSEYPWGTTIELDGDVIDKLGIDLGEVAVDQEFTLTAKCCVTRISSIEGRDEDRQQMSLQLKAISLDSANSMGDSVRKILARRFSGGGEGGESDGDE